MNQLANQNSWPFPRKILQSSREKATSLEKEKPWGGEVHANGNGNGMGLVSKVCHHVNVTFIMLFLWPPTPECPSLQPLYVEDACETEALMNLNAHMGKYENGMEKNRSQLSILTKIQPNRGTPLFCVFLKRKWLKNRRTFLKLKMFSLCLNQVNTLYISTTKLLVQSEV